MILPGDVYPILGASNSYLFERDRYCVLVDTSSSKSASKVINVIKSFCQNKPLSAVIITHAHYDHIAGLETIGILFGPDVMAHEIESTYIMKTAHMPKSNLFHYITGMIPASPYTIDRILNDHEVIFDFQIFYSPGHTPGSIMLLDLKTNYLVTGDAMRTDKKGTKILTPSRISSVNYKQAIESSINILKITKPKAILPGHGKPLMNCEGAVKDYIERASKVLQHK